MRTGGGAPGRKPGTPFRPFTASIWIGVEFGVAVTEDIDPYAVLGLTSVATPAEITHAFRVKLRDLHPDTRHRRAGGAGDIQLEQLIAAYHLLHDPERRARYDRNANAATAPRGQQPPDPSPSRDVSANSGVPLTIPVTYRSQPPAASYLIWAGPVRRHR